MTIYRIFNGFSPRILPESGHPHLVRAEAGMMAVKNLMSPVKAAMVANDYLAGCAGQKITQKIICLAVRPAGTKQAQRQNFFTLQKPVAVTEGCLETLTELIPPVLFREKGYGPGLQSRRKDEAVQNIGVIVQIDSRVTGT